MRLDVLGHVVVDTLKLFGQRLDDGVDAGPGLGVRLSQAVAFGHEHRDELAAARDQRRQHFLLDGGQRLDEPVAFGVTLDHLTQLRQDARPV